MDYQNYEHFKIAKENYDKLKNQYIKRSKTEGLKDVPDDESFHNYIWQELLNIEYEAFTSIEDGKYNENVTYAGYADKINNFIANHETQNVVRKMNERYMLDSRFRDKDLD